VLLDFSDVQSGEVHEIVIRLPKGEVIIDVDGFTAKVVCRATTATCRASDDKGVVDCGRKESLDAHDWVVSFLAHLEVGRAWSKKR
jgi:hypothetical protein